MNTQTILTLAQAPGAAGWTDSSVFSSAQALLSSRQNISPKRLCEPGPSEVELHQLMELAATAPDHGLLTPWRFVVVPREQRDRLAEVFALALLDRDAGATLEQIEAAREKAHRAPLLMVAIARLGGAPAEISEWERMVSVGAAIQNILLGAHAQGYGAGLTSGRAMASPRLAALLDLRAGERAVCCINVGTVQRFKRRARCRPAPADFLTVLGQQKEIVT